MSSRSSFAVSIVFWLGPFVSRLLDRDVRFQRLGGQPGVVGGFLMGCGAEGGFLLNDPAEEQVRNLTFDYVHDGVESASGNQQVVCVDFLDQNQERLDVDFFLAPAPSGELEVTEIKIHKVDGVERK